MYHRCSSKTDNQGSFKGSPSLNLNKKGAMLINSSSKSKHFQVHRFEACIHLVHQAVAEYRGIGTHCEKNDLLQEGFMHLWELIYDHSLPEDEFIPLAAIKIASRIRAVRRYQNKIRRLLPRLAILLVNQNNVYHDIVFENLNSSLCTLKPKQQKSIIKLYGLEGHTMSADEIAAEEGTSTRAIWARRKRGIDALRQNLNRHYSRAS
jgi:RNA polymerase sigma factor (sigma-70 family)